MVDDLFPDENIFTISVYSPWYVDLENYLVLGKMTSTLFCKGEESVSTL